MNSRYFKIIFFLITLAVMSAVSVFAQQAQSPNFQLTTSVVNSAGEKGNSSQYKLLWGTLGEVGEATFNSSNYKILSGFPDQLLSFSSSSSMLRIDSITPNTGPLAGGTAVTIKGNVFISGSIVTIGGKTLGSQIIQDSQTITGIIPAGDNIGKVDVTITNSLGTSTLTDGYLYNDSLAPIITNIVPLRGFPLRVVSIYGQHFTTTETTTVKFKNTPAVAIHVVDDQLALAIVPQALGPVPPRISFIAFINVTMQNTNGAYTFSNQFSYSSRAPADTTAPTVINLFPANNSVINQSQPQIKAVYQDNRFGVDFRATQLSLDGNDIKSLSRLTASDITFNPLTSLTGGWHTLILNIRDTVPNITPPVTWQFFIGPLITNVLPVNGSDVTEEQPTISATFEPIVGGTAIDTSSAALIFDGQDVTSQATITPTAITFVPPKLSTGLHSFTIDVADLDGNAALQAQSTFSITDITPPTVYITSHFNGQFVNENPLTVLGVANDPGLDMVLVNGIVATITDDNFSAAVSLVEGPNVIDVVAIDLAGNQRNQSIMVHLDTIPPNITIISPLDGATVDYYNITVGGTIDDPSALIFVNSVVGQKTSPTTWRALNVPLGIGVNTINVVANDTAGNQSTAIITVNTNTQTDAVTLTATPLSGIAPLNVNFITTTNVTGITQYEYDWEGDGVIDFTDSVTSITNHTYTAVDFYRPSVTVTTSGGQLFSAPTLINVHEPPVIEGQVSVTDPVDVEVDTNGLIYVLSRSPAQIKIFTFDENTSSFVLQNTINGTWLNPEGFELDTDLNIFVADTGNHRLQKMVPDGSGGYILDASFGVGGNLGSFGTGQGQFNSPFDVAVTDSEEIFVTDKNNHRVQKFGETGSFLLEFGSFGSGENQFNSPQGIEFSQSEIKVIVTDSGNHRLQIYNDHGILEQSFWSFGAGQGQLNLPVNSSADDIFNEIIVLDKANNRIQLLTYQGTFIQELNNLGLLNAQGLSAIPFPIDFILGKRLLYIADTGNNRLLRLEIPQGNSSDDLLKPYNDLIVALQNNNLDAAVNCYVEERQADRRILFEVLFINDLSGLADLGNEMALDPPPVLIQRMADSASFIISHFDEDLGGIIEYEMILMKENGQWKILDL